MSAEQVAEIAPAIREALDAGGGLCATFEMHGALNSWVQFIDGTVNAAYPGTSKPTELLSKLGYASLKEWEPTKFLSVVLSHHDARAIAGWIDRYFELALSAPPQYSVDVRLERL